MMAWLAQTLGDLCAPTEQRDPRRDPGRTFRYVDIAGIDRKAKTIMPPQVLPGSEAPSRARKVIRRDDVLVSTVRPNLNAVAMVPKELDGEIASTGFCVLRANRRFVEPRYLFYRTLSPGFVAALAASARGASYPAVSDRDVKNVEIAVPPLPEQKRIVEILDRAARVRRQRAEADAQAERVLPALLGRTLGDPARWQTDPRCKPLGTLAALVSGATPSKQLEDFWGGSIPWVSPKDMKVDLLSDSQDHVTENAIRQTSLRLLNEGSVLIVVRGMILARTVPVAVNLSPVTFSQDLKALVSRVDTITGTYIWGALRLAQRQLQVLVRTAGHGTRKLNTSDLMKFQIPLCEPREIEQVASAVEAHHHLVERRCQSRLSVNRLFEVVLHKAFDDPLASSEESGRRSHPDMTEERASPNLMEGTA